IQIIGATDAVVYLDDVFWNPQATFSPRFRGDFNADGRVDAADYTLWRNSLGSNGSGLAADANDDGTVDATDYLVWKRYYGNAPAALLSSLTPVPAPALGFVSLLATTILIACRNRSTP